MIKIDEEQLIDDLLATSIEFGSANKDFLQREYNNFIVLNHSLAYNSGKIIIGEKDILKKTSHKKSFEKYNLQSQREFLCKLRDNQELLKSIAKHLNRFSRKIKFENCCFLDSVKSFNENDFKEIILSYFRTYGDKYYRIVKSYFDNNRIQTDSEMFEEGLGGYFVPLIWLYSGYIFSKYSKYNTFTAASIVHELGHAIDSELFLFPQQKKIPLHDDLFLEIPSISFEVGFYDYLKSQKIDYNGGLVLANNRAATLIYEFKRIRQALLSKELYLYENGVAENEEGLNYNLRVDVIYGLGYYFGFHLSEIRKNNPKEFLELLNYLMTMRKEISLEDAIEKTGFNREDFINGRYIKPRIKEDCLELKRRYKLD